MKYIIELCYMRMEHTTSITTYLYRHRQELNIIHFLNLKLSLKAITQISNLISTDRV